MSLVQIGAVAIFGANLVGYVLYWIEGNQLAQVDKLLWMVLMFMVFGLEVIGGMLSKEKENEDDY